MSYYDIVNAAKVKDDAIILAIESSCDETAAAILKGGREILSSVIMSSATEHVKFGGVVPEIASRAHTAAISLTVEKAIKDAGVTLKDIDAVAVTYGAGLLGALLVGVSYAKALAFSLNVPLIPVSHIRGHLAAAYLADKTLEPPFISVLASGGHTAIIAVKNYYEFEVLGQTLDDAVGESLDKIARTLGLPYPGGPNIERLAKEGKADIVFPKMLKGKHSLDFSYSGLKTFVINYIHNNEQKGVEFSKADVAASFQTAAIDVLVNNAVAAAEKYGYSVITAGGGVVANSYLRESLTLKAAEKGIKVVLPEKKFCTDNAAMIGAEGYLQYKKRNFADLTLNAKASVSLS